MPLRYTSVYCASRPRTLKRISLNLYEAMLLNMSFEADSDEGREDASPDDSTSVSSSANIESSTAIELSGTIITLPASFNILPTRTIIESSSNSGVAKCSVYVPPGRLSKMNAPLSSVVAVSVVPSIETLTPPTASRPSRETTLPLTPPFCANAPAIVRTRITVRKNRFI